MSDRYILTVYIAEGGTPMFAPGTEERIRTGKSLAGHMWYSLQQGDGPEYSYGFGSSEGEEPGKVTRDDTDMYYNPLYKTIRINEQQYARLSEFGENGIDKNWSFYKDKGLNFDGHYNPAPKCCGWNQKNAKYC